MSWHIKTAVLATALVTLCLFTSDPAFADFVWRNGRWVDNYTYRPARDPLIWLSFMRLILVAGSAALGFAIGWFFSPQGHPARQIILILLGVVAMGVVLIDQSALGWSTATLMAIVGFFWGIGFWLGKGLKQVFDTPTTFGSAKWADAEHLTQKGLFTKTKGLLLGLAFDGNLMSRIYYSGDRHALTVAPNRSGKGFAHIIPNLLKYLGSVLVIDPKGENAIITAKRREEMGQKVHLIDPWDIAATKSGFEPARINPLDWITMDDPDAPENAKLLTDALVQSKPKSDPFWLEEAKALLQGLILLVALDETYEGRRNLGTVRDLMLLDGKEMKALFQYMANSAHPLIVSTGSRSLQKEEKLMANVLASVQAETHMLDSHRVRDALSASDFSFEDLKKDPMSVFLILPADRLNSFNAFLRLMVQQAITVNARNITDKPEKPVLFILDEMPALGRLSMLEQAYGLMAGFGMQFWGIVQDLSQLRRVYGEDYESFIANCGMVSYFGSPDKRTAEYFSSLCGVTTVPNLSTAVASAVSHNFGSGGGGSESTTSTDTRSATQRKLAYPDELMRMHQDQQLIFIENTDPILSEKIKWFEDPELSKLGVDTHKS